MRNFACSLIVATVSLPSLTYAQGTCPADPPRPDPCIVGNWIGENSAGEAVRRAIESNAPPGVTMDVIPDMPPLLGIAIFDDGFYATLPLHANTSVLATQDGETTQVIMDLNAMTQIGHIWTETGVMSFCSLGSAGVMLQAEITDPEGNTSNATIVPMGDDGFTPFITYSCAGDALQMTVALPSPIGDINYDLQRVATNRFDATFQERLSDRFGTLP